MNQFIVTISLVKQYLRECVCKFSNNSILSKGLLAGLFTGSYYLWLFPKLALSHMVNKLYNDSEHNLNVSSSSLAYLNPYPTCYSSSKSYCNPILIYYPTATAGIAITNTALEKLSERWTC